MSQDLAIWILILLAWLTATLPFAVERPFVALPWAQQGEPERPIWLRWLESLAFFILLAAIGRLGLIWISESLVISGDMGSAAAFLGKLALIVGLLAALLAYPGWRARGHAVRKSFFARLIELLVFYGLVGALGVAFEALIGNVFPQGWEFYAITLSLYMVLAYPGFVYRYLLRRKKA